jgi:hypothetical protein
VSPQNPLLKAWPGQQAVLPPDDMHYRYQGQYLSFRAAKSLCTATLHVDHSSEFAILALGEFFEYLGIRRQEVDEA